MAAGRRSSAGPARRERRAAGAASRMCAARRLRLRASPRPARPWAQTAGPSPTAAAECSTAGRARRARPAGLRTSACASRGPAHPRARTAGRSPTVAAGRSNAAPALKGRSAGRPTYVVLPDRPVPTRSGLRRTIRGMRRLTPSVRDAVRAAVVCAARPQMRGTGRAREENAPGRSMPVNELGLMVSAK